MKTIRFGPNKNSRNYYEDNRESVLEQQREYYQQNKQARINRQRKRVWEMRERLREYKAEHACADCGGEFDPVCMDFDHLDPAIKSCGVSAGVNKGWSWERVLQEIAKCELVCANCHRVRSHTRLHE